MAELVSSLDVHMKTEPLDISEIIHYHELHKDNLTLNMKSLAIVQFSLGDFIQDSWAWRLISGLS